MDTGFSFTDACQFLTDKLGTHSRTWASYGDYDRKQFVRQCESFGVPYPFSASHQNVKRLFAQAHCLPREVGMAGALKRLGWPLEGTHHRALDDARNISKNISPSPRPMFLTNISGRIAHGASHTNHVLIHRLSKVARSQLLPNGGICLLVANKVFVTADA